MYQAIVAKLENVKKLPNSDFLQIASCFGYSVIVGLEAKENDIVVLFPDDGQLSEEYCKYNNLYIKPEMNDNPEKKGYFDHKRRVKAQTFRGARSEAYVASLDSLVYTRKVSGIDPSKLELGTRFTEINGFKICDKYITPATRNKGCSNNSKSPKGANNAEMKKIFLEHFETEQFRHARDYDLHGLVIVTLKVHGTCLSYDTLLHTQNGLKSIGQIFDTKYNGKVLSFNTETLDEEWKEIDDYFCYENEDNWYEIELENGKKIIMTKDHLVYLPELGCYREAKDLIVGQNLLVS